MTLLSDATAMPLHDLPTTTAPGETTTSTFTVPLPNVEDTSTTGPPKVKAVHDLIAGGVAGSASVVVGHPFDTIKVRMQMSSGTAASTTGCKFSTLFRGIGAPLSTAAVVNAIIFASYGATSRLWDAYYHIPHDEEEDFHGVVAGSEGAILLEHGKHPTSKNQIAKNLVCGGIAGIVQSLVICPMEHVKCRLQVQSANSVVYKNSLHAANNIVSQQGVRGLYRGMASTCWREGKLMI
jgi:solute carrier family 25 carnitine/acylcarnitine transporter 20/29